MMISLGLLDSLRLLCGLFFLPHLVLKFVFFSDTVAFFERAGFRYCRQLILLDAAVEIVVSVMLIAKIVPWFAALLGASHLTVAAVAVWRANGHTWRWNRGGPEYPLFWALLCMLVSRGYWN